MSKIKIQITMDAPILVAKYASKVIEQQLLNVKQQTPAITGILITVTE